MQTLTKTFTGPTHADCRGLWSKFCDEQPSEPYLIRAEAHRAGSICEWRVTYTLDVPQEAA